ncbi:hypothetical protein RvY_02695 [Ramazzottius varieornatus]|uniref:HTH psq-type domain-containing protein n=1 Tax=Ramazzottius varieornatus TaxID=947166 RepID=A0A1D1UVR4_RAMVA|nr:hypothetical protein RvY_02695 [Ramazzottius varieornatus]
MSQPFKTKRPRRYTEEALKDALSAVENGMGLREAARVFKVPRNTVSRYVQDTKARRLGKERKLNDFEEGLLVIEQRLKSRKEPSKTTPKSRGGTNRKGMACESSPSTCLPAPDIPSTSEPKSMPKKSRKKEVCSPEEPSACPLSNADVSTLAPAPPKKRVGSKKVQ